MAKALTVAGLNRLNPDPKKRREIPDGLLTGLYFVVQPTGRKSWAVRYRHQGRPRKIVLGNYPTLELQDARDIARDILQHVQKGIDPAAEKQAEKKRDKDETITERTRFENVARTFLTRHAKPNNRSWKETARQLGFVPDKSEEEGARDDPQKLVVRKGSIADAWGERSIAEINRPDIIELLDGIADRGAPVLANRTLATVRKLFNWAIARGLVDNNPCDKVQPPAAERARDRVLTDDEIKAFWQACEAIGWPFGPAFQLLLLTSQRRSEVGLATWDEITENTWTIPRERVKTDRAHVVPLSAQALNVLNQLPRIKGRGFLFTTNGERPVSGYSKAKGALDRKIFELLCEDDKGATLPPWRLHDLRRTAASGMASLGIGVAVVEKVLNHTSGSFGGIVGVYQRHEFADEKKRALDTWGAHVESLTSGTPGENVLELARFQQ